MSFKSKQRAKHGHLFGDDPLSATLISASDDPLFAPTKTSQSSRTNSPVSNDPLSRNSRPSSPLDTSSSTPITPRRTTNTKTSGSIFGDIDVSKLGGANGNSNGLYNKRVSTTSLRSTATLRSSRQFDEDEEDLFGGGRASRARVVSKATSPTLSNTSTTVNKKSPPSNSSSILSEPTTVLPTPRKAVPSPPPPNQSPIARQSTPVIEAPTTPSPPPIEENTRPVVEEKPSSSFFASASRFFKSSSNTQSKSSSSASSIASVNSPNVQHEDPVLPNPRQPSQATLPPPPPQPQQQEQPQQPQQQKPSVFKRIIPNIQPKTIDKPTVDNSEEEEEEEETNDVHHIIEDEATRAFADDVISFKPKNYQPDYAAISPDLSMDALRLDTHTNKRLIPSASTPTASQADVDDPWFDGAAILTSTATSNTSHKLPILANIEPSISSPLRQQHQHKISVQDIEPQKRTAFADLISSWNTGQTNNNVYETVHKVDPEQFFNHVAEEQRDIGFAGITGEDDENDFEHRRTRTISAVDVWDDNEENPWS